MLKDQPDTEDVEETDNFDPTEIIFSDGIDDDRKTKAKILPEIEKEAELRAALIPSFWLTQLLLLIPGGVLLWLFYLRKGYELRDFFAWDNAVEIWLFGTFLALFWMGLQFAAWRIFPVDAFDDGVNRLLLELPVQHLFPMYLIAALAEELFVRGVLQTGIMALYGSVQGVVFTSILFTVMHIRYLKKPVLMSAVFLISLGLCSLYSYTGTLWATIWAHFLYNFGASVLAKKYYLPLFETPEKPSK